MELNHLEEDPAGREKFFIDEGILPGIAWSCVHNVPY